MANSGHAGPCPCIPRVHKGQPSHILHPHGGTDRACTLAACLLALLLQAKKAMVASGKAVAAGELLQKRACKRLVLACYLHSHA